MSPPRLPKKALGSRLRASGLKRTPFDASIPILTFNREDRADNAPVTVIGIVDDVKYSGFEAPADGVIYRPFAQQPSPIMFVVARTIDDLAGMESALRREIAGVDPTIVIYAVNTVDGLVSEAIAQPRFRTMVILGLAAVALTLAAVGLYGVVAYTVAQRTAEIGIRIALGATAADVVRMVLREGMLLVLVGLAIGVGSALALTRILRNLLYGVQPTDMLSFVGAAATLLLVTFLASYIPARRATRVDPLAALRCE